MLPRLNLVLGGTAPGKSAFAENLTGLTFRPRHRIATAQAFDEEMRAKRAAHRVQRGHGQRTREAPLDLAPSLLPPLRRMLSCWMLWLDNHMLAEHDLAPDKNALMSAGGPCAAQVLVSNKVGLSVVPDTTRARRFQNAQRALNQRLAAGAGLVVKVIAGLPQVLRGIVP